MRARALLLLALFGCGKKEINAGVDAGAKMAGRDFSCAQAPNITARSAAVAGGRLHVLDESGGLISFDPSFRSYRVHWESSHHRRILTGGDGSIWTLEWFRDQVRTYRLDERAATVGPFPVVVAGTVPDVVAGPFGDGLAVLDPTITTTTRFVSAAGKVTEDILRRVEEPYLDITNDPANPKCAYASTKTTVEHVCGTETDTVFRASDSLSSIATRGAQAIVVGTESAYLIDLKDPRRRMAEVRGLPAPTRRCGVEILDQLQFWLVRTGEHKYAVVPKP